MAIGSTPTEVIWNITKSTDGVVSFTVTDSNSDPFDISGYEFYFVAREYKSPSSTQAIEILNGDIVQSDSGTGTTDTFTIDITNSLSNLNQRTYFYEIRSKHVSSGDNAVWFNGPLNVEWTVQGAR